MKQNVLCSAHFCRPNNPIILLSVQFCYKEKVQFLFYFNDTDIASREVITLMTVLFFLVTISISSEACHLAELEGDTLNLYGAGSMEALDKNWGVQAAGSVTTVSFKFIDFEEVAKHLHKIRIRFPNVSVSTRYVISKWIFLPGKSHVPYE